MKVHYRDIRLFNNAGISFPRCYANQRLLDLTKTALPTTSDRKAVTCSNCRRSLKYETPTRYLKRSFSFQGKGTS